MSRIKCLAETQRAPESRFSGGLASVAAVTIALCLPITVRSAGVEDIRIVANSACAAVEEGCATKYNTYCRSRVDKYAFNED